MIARLLGWLPRKAPDAVLCESGDGKHYQSAQMIVIQTGNSYHPRERLYFPTYLLVYEHGRDARLWSFVL